MCGVPQAQLALTAISAVGQVQEYREQKALAASKRAANNRTRENAQVAYMRDINKIDQEKVQADQEKAAAKIKTDMEKKKKIRIPPVAETIIKRKFSVGLTIPLL